MSTINNPIGPGFCGIPKRISTGSSGVNPTDPVILGFVPMVLGVVSDGLDDGAQLLLTLEQDCEFGMKGEYPAMPIDGNIYSGFLGSAIADNDDVAQVAANIGVYQIGGTASININSGLVQNITGSTFLGTLTVDVILVDTVHFTIRIRTVAGQSITRPFRIRMMDLGLMRKIAITTKP